MAKEQGFELTIGELGTRIKELEKFLKEKNNGELPPQPKKLKEQIQELCNQKKSSFESGGLRVGPNIHNV